jgi:pyruvate/2-oxoglutarate/acetoin dehydrogenase E1 component
MTIPGLKIIAPSSPADVKGLLKSAVRDDDPVICFEAVSLWTSREHVSLGEHLIPLGRAEVKHPGDDVTVVAIGPMVPLALEAAETLAGEGVSVEVVDPRTLVPMDWATILDSAGRTGRLVVADVGQRTCSAASEIVATACEELYRDLRAAPQRVTTPDIPIPFSPALESPLYPTAGTIADAVRRTVVT